MLNGIQVEQAWLTAGIQRAVNAGVMPVHNGLPRYSPVPHSLTHSLTIYGDSETPTDLHMRVRAHVRAHTGLT
jgi:hypothetical protein